MENFRQINLLAFLFLLSACNTSQRAARGNQQPSQSVDCSSVDLQKNPTFTKVVTPLKKGDNIVTVTTDVTTTKQNPTFEETLKSDTTVTANGLDCTTKIVSINATSSTFMNADYAAQGQFIYPGAIYDYQDFISGQYKSIAENRNPIKLTTDNPNTTGGTTELICEPDMASIREGIANLYSRFNPKEAGTMNLRYQTYESSSKAELSLRITSGASFSTFSIENEYKNSSNTTNHYLTIDAIKPLFTINTVLPNSKSYFKKDLDTSVKNPVIISSVTYGIRVLANFNLDTKTKEELDNFHAKYNGATNTAKLDLEYLSKNENTDQTINCYVVGGPGNSTVAFDKSELEKGIKDLVAGVTYATARPISYTLSDLNGNIIETKSATDDITTMICTPHIDPPTLQDVIVKTRTGGNDKDHDTHYEVFLRKGIDGSFSRNGDCKLSNFADRHYNNNSSVVENMQTVARSLTYSDFVNRNGGSVYIQIFPNGDDTWSISSLSLVLIFKNGTIKTINFNGFDISDESTGYVMFFNRNFEPIQ